MPCRLVQVLLTTGSPARSFWPIRSITVAALISSSLSCSSLFVSRFSSTQARQPLSGKVLSFTATGGT